MKEKQQKIKQEIQTWIEKNQNQLSPSANSWQVEIVEKPENTVPLISIKLGKYNTEPTVTDPFYKPYSKMHLL
jgi:hypothetical protein